jgi:hypothetical protein
MLMEKVYILLEKNLETEQVRVAGVFAKKELAESEMDCLMDFNEEEKSYKIEEQEIQ